MIASVGPYVFGTPPFCYPQFGALHFGYPPFLVLSVWYPSVLIPSIFGTSHFGDLLFSTFRTGSQGIRTVSVNWWHFFLVSTKLTRIKTQEVRVRTEWRRRTRVRSKYFVVNLIRRYEKDLILSLVHPSFGLWRLNQKSVTIGRRTWPSSQLLSVLSYLFLLNISLIEWKSTGTRCGHDR